MLTDSNVVSDTPVLTVCGGIIEPTIYPTVTVIINAHNSEKSAIFTPRALDSLLRQQFSETWEVIYINDGPLSEDMRSMISTYDDKFADMGVPFSVMALTESSGYQCRPKNAAIYHAKGEYIAFLDYDNEFTDDHLQVLYDAFIYDNDGKLSKVWPDFTYGRRRYVVDEGVDIANVKIPGTNKIATLSDGESPYVAFNDYTVKYLLQNPLCNFIDTSDIMISKGIMWNTYINTGKMWNEELRRWGDWEFIVRVIVYGSGRGKAVDKVVQLYHWTGQNLQLTRAAKETPSGVHIDEVSKQ